MKKILSLLFLAILIFNFSACFKDGHSIRIKNNSTNIYNNFFVDSVNFGDVSMLQTTDYKPIPAGAFTFSATTIIGGTLTGSGTVSGKGQRRWTILITSSTNIKLVRD